MFTPPSPGTTAPSRGRISPSTVLAVALAFAALVVSLLATVPADAALPVPTAGAAQQPSGGRTYYVDPRTGSDDARGSLASPWRTLNRASRADLQPGDVLRLRAARRHLGALVLEESGTREQPIRVEKFGRGRYAWMRGGPCVVLRGDNLVVTGVRAVRCAEAGFNIEGDRVTVTRVSASRNIRGVWVKEGSRHAVVSFSVFRRNTRMAPGTPGADDDHGAQGIDINGDFARISRNRIIGHRAPSHDYGEDGAAVEIYQAVGTVVDRNRASGNLTFTELGGPRTRSTRFVGNRVRSSLRNGSFLMTRGAGQVWGPVYNTVVEANRVTLTGAKSFGFGCYGGCTPKILVMRGNLISAGWYVGWADGTFRTTGNTYRGELWFRLGPGDRMM